MFTPGLAIFYKATLRPDHVCGVQSSRVWRKSRFLEHSIGSRLSSPSPSPSRRQGIMDRASQVLAQGVPPGMPKSYRALADHHGNVSHSTVEARTIIDLISAVISIIEATKTIYIAAIDAKRQPEVFCQVAAR
jgi:hypothetical protein